ncbi:MAG: dephospho-CoA kinase, partial [Burkholderiaceae bacterium]
MAESSVPSFESAASGAFIVGLTGGIGSGKSTVADLFTTHGIVLVDTDLIAHELTVPGGAAMPAIEQTFGNG